jgi:PPOX class probable F420-dependent enzyme
VTVSTLASERYLSLTTFKRDGTPVATPVWVMSDDGRRLLVRTGADTWKAKRLRRDPRVLVAASDFRGREKGERIPGKVRFLEAVDGKLVEELASRKYGLWKTLAEGATRLTSLIRREKPQFVYLEITDRDEPGGGASQQQV